MKLYQPLYQRTTVREGRFPYSPPADHSTPLELTLAFLYDLSECLTEKPIVWQPENSYGVTVLFPDSMVSCDDFLGQYQEIMGRISSVWPLSVLGSTPERETGEILVGADDSGLHFCLKNVSGQNFDTLYGICVQLIPQSAEEALFLNAALERLDYRKPCISLSGEFRKEAEACGLFLNTPDSSFLYLSFQEDTGSEDLLEALSLSQKEALWLGFLRSGACPAEFSMLDELYHSENCPILLEWELSLQAALDQMGFKVCNKPHQFAITKPDGTPLRIDFIHGCSGERMFLKLLFPATPKATL